MIFCISYHRYIIQIVINIIVAYIKDCVLCILHGYTVHITYVIKHHMTAQRHPVLPVYVCIYRKLITSILLKKHIPFFYFVYKYMLKKMSVQKVPD
jgi:hypothetical protein